MKCGHRKLDKTEVSIAQLQWFATGLAMPIFARYTHASVERPMALNCAVALQVEEFPVTDLKNCLVDYVLA